MCARLCIFTFGLSLRLTPYFVGPFIFLALNEVVDFQASSCREGSTDDALDSISSTCTELHAGKISIAMLGVHTEQRMFSFLC